MVLILLFVGCNLANKRSLNLLKKLSDYHDPQQQNRVYSQKERRSYELFLPCPQKMPLMMFSLP